tara:strand:- start:608 stop:1087 length:480 start_codon:yes stop_codon:yes gene_type:complete
MRKIIFALILSFLANSSYAQGFSMTSGILDYSDDQKRSGFIEATLAIKNENNENLFGNFTPITGAMITQDNATMLYSGIKGIFEIGNFFVSPSLASGYYDEGNGKDLGSHLEFKSQINLGWKIGNKSNAGFSYSHISNANLGDRNPGANNIAFTFFRQY